MTIRGENEVSSVKGVIVSMKEWAENLGLRFFKMGFARLDKNGFSGIAFVVWFYDYMSGRKKDFRILRSQPHQPYKNSKGGDGLTSSFAARLFP